MKTRLFPGRLLAGAAMITAAYVYTKKNKGITGFVCLSIGSALLSKSVCLS